MKIFLSITLILCSSFVFSQKKVSGVVADSLGMPIPFTSIGLLSLPDSNLVKGTITDEAGKYSIDQLGFGKYILKIASIDYQEKIIENIVVDSSSNNNLIFNITLSPSLHTLGEVSITAIKRVVEVKNGNIIVNVEDSPLAKGNSVYDLLTKLPGVSVDDKKIMIQGKAGVIVMIDERSQTLSDDQLINLLKSMNADLVNSIEILKNPPVKYDASGTSGMINIISKKVTVSGLTGTVFYSYFQGFYEQQLPGASLNYKSKKIIIYSSLSGNYSHYRRVQNLKRIFTSDSTTMDLINDNVTKIFETNLNYKVGMDWLLAKADVLGIQIEGDQGKNISNSAGRNSVFGNNTLGFNHTDAKIIILDKWSTTDLNFNYEHKMDTLGSSFTVATDYSILKENVSGENFNTFYNADGIQIFLPVNYRNDNQGNSNMFAGRADVVKIINTSTSIESGIKTAYSKTANEYLFEKEINSIYVKDTSVSNTYRYSELTYAGYFNYIKSIKKLSMRLGVRLEKTSLAGENDRNFELHKEYFNVFPNFSFDYKRNDDHDFQLNLSRRINRPSFYDLNPFVFFEELYSFYQGNPFLLPDYSNRGELSYNYKNFLFTSLAYSYTQNILLPYTSQNDSTNVVLQSIKNMKSSDAFEYSIFYQKSLTNKWDLSVSGSLARMSYKGNIDGVYFHRTVINYSGNITTGVLVGKNTKLEISGRYLGPSITGIIQKKPRWMSSIACKTTLFKEKLDLTLGVDDIFYSFVFKSSASFENQNWSYKQINDSRRFKISINYKFGKINIEQREVIKSNEEEKERFNH